MSSMGKSIERKVDQWLPGLAAGQNGERLLMGLEFLFGVIRTF